VLPSIVLSCLGREREMPAAVVQPGPIYAEIPQVTMPGIRGVPRTFEFEDLG